MQRAWLAVLLAGCTHHRPLNALDEAEGHIVEAETTNGHVSDAYVTTDHNYFVLRPGVGPEVPGNQVVRVTDVRRGRGAYEGFLIAGGAGLLVGMTLGIAAGDDHCSDYCILALSAGDKAVLLGGTFSFIGGALGLIVGAAVGSRYVYEDQPQNTVRVRAGGPPGSTAGLTVTF